MSSNSKNTEVYNTILKSVYSIANRRSTPWVGTMSQLNETIVRAVRGNLPDGWPKSPSALRIALNSALNKLKSEGVRVNFSRNNDYNRTRIVEISKR